MPPTISSTSNSKSPKTLSRLLLVCLGDILSVSVSRYIGHTRYRRAIVAVSGVQAFGQLTCFNTLLYLSGTILGLLGLKNSSAAGLIPSGGNSLCVLIGISIVDRVGRRRLRVFFILVCRLDLYGLWSASIASGARSSIYNRSRSAHSR